jgi:putative lipoprotein (rSAM/lipoprotein system)
MKIITGGVRKILSRLFRVISVSAASLILQACYGMMPPEEPVMYGMPPSTTIEGKVSAKETGEPIFGIKVSIEETNEKYWEYTDKYGGFKFEGVPIKNDYKIKCEDVDGPYNGGLFKEKTLTLIKQGDINNLIFIELDLDS